jgi:ubiquinone biosynthesis protein
MTTLANEMAENASASSNEKVTSERAGTKREKIDRGSVSRDSHGRDSYGRDNALKAGLELLNAAISALEATAWQGRELIDEVKERVQGFDQDKDDLIEEVTSIAGKAKKIPIRLKRMAKTALTLSLITGSYRLWGTRSAFISAEKQEAALTRLHTKNAKRFKNASLEHGGAFLKVGQLISARSDVMPATWVKELQVLQDQAKPVPFRDIKEVIEAELKKPIDKVFSEFVGEPIAAASIGQVHEARLLNGERVAVKVQRPDIEETVSQDMALMKLFLNALEPMLPPTDMETISKEVERSIMKELSYEQERKWMTKVGDFLKVNSKVIVPKAIPEFCTDKVLVSEFVEAIKLTDRLEELHQIEDKELISDLLGQLLDCYMQQILNAGVFQADPHPGNILVTKDNQLVLLDFGCTMVLPHNFKIAYRKILMAAMIGDKEAMAKSIMDLGFKTKSGKPDTLIAFADSLLDNIKNAATNSNSEMQWPEGDEIFTAAMELLKQAEHDPVIKLPAEFIMLARVFSTLGGLFMHYKPNLDMQKYLIPHLQMAV